MGLTDDKNINYKCDNHVTEIWQYKMAIYMWDLVGFIESIQRIDVKDMLG